MFRRLPSQKRIDVAESRDSRVGCGPFHLERYSEAHASSTTSHTVTPNCHVPMYSESESESSDSDWEMNCCGEQGCSRLPFDPTALQDVILSISDRFDFRVIMAEGKAQKALIITTGLTIAGSVIGRRYGGNIGAALGGAVGGACGLGIAAVSMREIWNDVKSKLSELFDVAYDYLAGLGVGDYRAAAALVAGGGGDCKHLALLLADVATKLLDKKVVSSITPPSP